MVANNTSASARRQRIYSLIEVEDTSERALIELLPEGEPHQYEKQLWDYKVELPTLARDPRPNEYAVRQYELKMAEIVKDAVSFYNTHGGYLVIGVRDKPREVVGFERNFDCDELNRKKAR